jgi:putative redox protein
MQFNGTADSGHVVTLDAAASVGGQNLGFRPTELLLISLAGCTAMDVISILRKKRQDVTGLEVRTDGKRADDHPKVYTDITIEYIVSGRGVDPAAVERAIQLSSETYCTVEGMLKKAATITTSYRIVEVD